MKRRRRLAIGLATTLVTLVLVLVLFDHFVVDLDTFFEVIGSNAKEMF
jgi:hypothetical protein